MTLKELIWAGGSGWVIMWKARGRFYATSAEESLSKAYSALASTHYSLSKRWWTGPFALWHALRALQTANTAFAFSREGTDLTPDEIDVVSRIFSRAILVRKEHQMLAGRLIDYALQKHPDRSNMVPHTRAHLLETKGFIEEALGRKQVAIELVMMALDLESEIRLSTVPDALQQLVRIKANGGFFLFQHGNYLERFLGRKQVREARKLAEDNSADQLRKINMLIWWHQVDV